MPIDLPPEPPAIIEEVKDLEVKYGVPVDIAEGSFLNVQTNVRGPFGTTGWGNLDIRSDPYNLDWEDWEARLLKAQLDRAFPLGPILAGPSAEMDIKTAANDTSKIGGVVKFKPGNGPLLGTRIYALDDGTAELRPFIYAQTPDKALSVKGFCNMVIDERDGQVKGTYGEMDILTHPTNRFSTGLEFRTSWKPRDKRPEINPFLIFKYKF